MRLAFDEDALYMAMRCLDSQPGKILSTTMARDGRPFDDDNLEIVIDPFHDRRSGYYLQLNAAGSMSDGRIIENRLADVSWDGIWNARTRIDEHGWIAELEIPFKTLSFRSGVGTWGFNIERTIARVNEESRWEGYILDSSIHAVSRGGDIEGLKGSPRASASTSSRTASSATIATSGGPTACRPNTRPAPTSSIASPRTCFRAPPSTPISRKPRWTPGRST